MAGTSTCGFCRAPPLTVYGLRSSALWFPSGSTNAAGMYAAGGAGQPGNATGAAPLPPGTDATFTCASGPSGAAGIWVPPGSPAQCSAPCAGLSPGVCLATDFCGLCTAADGSTTCLLAADIGLSYAADGSRPSACPAASGWQGPNSLVGTNLSRAYPDYCAAASPACSSCVQGSLYGGCGYCKSSGTCLPSNDANNGPLSPAACSTGTPAGNWLANVPVSTPGATDQCPAAVSCTSRTSCSTW